MSQLLKFINENTDGEFETIKTKLTSEDIKLIIKEDPDDNLWLARYKKQVFNRDIHDFVPHSNMELDFVKESRGIILEKGSNRVVCYPPDASVSYENIWEENISDMSFHLAIEGTQVTLYNYNGRWGISTKGAINSANSRWMSSRSFLDMFLKMLLQRQTLIILH